MFTTRHDVDEYVHLPDNFYAAVSEAKGKLILFIPIFSTFQTGKSSTLKKLTEGISDIVIGKGINDARMGSVIYGPYSYNKLMKKFELEEVDDNNTQVFFFDTEGCVSTSYAGMKFHVDHIVVPYCPLFCTVVTIIRPTIIMSDCYFLRSNI